MLTLPLAFAALTAGAVGGVHCAGMCGGIASLLSKKRVSDKPAGTASPMLFVQNQRRPRLLPGFSPYQFQLHCGRIFTYVLAGAVIGGMGGAGMLLKPYMPVQTFLFVAGNLMLIFLGLRLLGLIPAAAAARHWLDRVMAGVASVMPSLPKGGRYPFFVGMGWGCLPCGLLYGVAPLALLTGDAWSGALVMLIFGVAALPHLLLTQRLLARGRAAAGGRIWRLGSSVALIAIGLFGLFHSDMKAMPELLCVVPR